MASETLLKNIDTTAMAAEVALSKVKSESSGIVTKVPHVYVDITNLSTQVKEEFNVPVCCENTGPFCSMLWFCLSFTFILPLIFYLFSLSADVLTANSLQTISVVLLIIGTLYCCCLTSFPSLIKDGVLCMPKGPANTSAWEVSDSKNNKQSVKKLKVIVNPHAGVKAGKSNLSICKDIWENMGIAVEVIETTHAGHCRTIAMEESLDDCDALCAIGGDGTLHELCNGYLARDDEDSTPLGFLPGGSGNSIMAGFGTWDMAEAAKRIGNGGICLMDAIEVSTMEEKIVSINTICFGLLGQIGSVAENFRCLGPARYNAVAVGKIMLGYKEKVVISLEDADGKIFQLEDHYLAIFINQTQHFGKGLRCAPTALVDDGLMDFYAIKAGSVTRGDQLAMLQQMPTGSHMKHPGIYQKQCKSCTITLPGPGIFVVDGENVKHNGKIKMICRKNKVPVLADRGSLALQL
jgi:diacylglycerol kinase family enzyme